MTKAVLIPIQPRWCDRIETGGKTIEIRKTSPKIELPFKSYIYCTQFKYGEVLCFPQWKTGKVIGEFTCDEIIPIHVFDNGSIQDWNHHNLETARVPYDEMAAYIGWGKKGYGWHISNLLLYDKPKPLSDFERPCKCIGKYEGELYCDCLNCEDAGDSDYGVVACDRKLKRPPQSWCYVEPLKGGSFSG